MRQAAALALAAVVLLALLLAARLPAPRGGRARFGSEALPREHGPFPVRGIGDRGGALPWGGTSWPVSRFGFGPGFSQPRWEWAGAAHYCDECAACGNLDPAGVSGFCAQCAARCPFGAGQTLL
jgi:hypothetical protein